MPDDDRTEDDEENLSTVGSGGVDALFEEIESTIGTLDDLSGDLESVRRRIEANEGETSGHVRSRVDQEADRLADEVADATGRLREELRELKRSV